MVDSKLYKSQDQAVRPPRYTAMHAAPSAQSADASAQHVILITSQAIFTVQAARHDDLAEFKHICDTHLY